MSDIFALGFDRSLNKPTSGISTPTVYDSLSDMIDVKQVSGLQNFTDRLDSLFDATVGSSGADFVTISSAAASGFDRLLVVDNVTEVADVEIPTRLFIQILPGKTVAMGEYSFRVRDSELLVIRGEGTITYSHTGTSALFIGNGTDPIVDIAGVTVTSTSTAAAPFNLNCIIRIENITYNCANVAAGISLGMDFSYASNIRIVGGGTSCSLAIQAPNDPVNLWVDGVSFTGVFNSSAGNPAASFLDGVISNLIWAHGTNQAILHVGSNVEVSNVLVTGSQNLALTISGAYATVNNADLLGGNINLSSFDSVRLNNVVTTGVFSDDSTATNALVSNCRFESASTIDGDSHKFTNCDFVGGATITSGSDNNGFVNCQFGADAGGGALTLTINAGSNNTRVVSCMSDAAIVDGGTGTTTAANIVY